MFIAAKTMKRDANLPESLVNLIYYTIKQKVFK